MIEHLKGNENLSFQHRNWKAERIAWTLMTLIIAVALLGLMGGNGLLAQEVKYSQSGLIGAQHNRYTRLGNTARLKVYIKDGAKDKARLWVHKDFFEVYQITQITPQPESSFTTPDRLWFVFRAVEPKQPLAIAFHLRSEHVGTVKTQIGTTGSGPLKLSQFVYP